MISISATTGLPDTIRASGADPVLVLRAAGIELSAIADVEGFIPASVFAHVLDEAARATADDFFGLHFGEQFDPKDVGALAYGVLNSPTVAAAIANLVRYMRIHNRGAEISLSITDTPASAQTWAMPLPICPAPTTPSFRMICAMILIRSS